MHRIKIARGMLRSDHSSSDIRKSFNSSRSVPEHNTAPSFQLLTLVCLGKFLLRSVETTSDSMTVSWLSGWRMEY
jgi:hypothetical protein